jgi:hypothetical protein
MIALTSRSTFRTAAVLVALTLAAGSSGAAATVDDDTGRLLDRHLRWRGGRDAFARMVDVSFEGTLSAAGLSGPLTIHETVTGWSRHRYDLGVHSRTEVLGPDHGFAINASGQREPIPDPKRARRRFATQRTFGLHLLGAADITVERLPDEVKDGATWNVLRFVQSGTEPFDLFLDPDGRAGWTREADDLDTAWTRLGDWREVQGIQFPHHEQSTWTDASNDSAVHWSAIRVNTGIEGKTFAETAPSARLARIAGDAPSSGWIPMDLHLGRWIYLKARLNGHDTEVVLDSGAGATVVDAAFAERLGLRGTGEVGASGVGGMQKASFVEGLRIEVGAVTFDKLRGILIDLSGVERRLGRSMPVILGKEAFQALVVDIDYPAARIAFHAPDTFVYEGAGHTVPLLAGEDGHRLVEVSTEDLPPARFTLDTGSGGTVDFFDAFTAKHRLLDGRAPTSEARGGGVGGTVVFKTGTIRSLRFAGFELTRVPVQFSSEQKGAFGTREIAGNLGAGIFGRFRLIFDYSREKLHVEPGPEWDKKPFRKDRLGLSLDFEDGALVVRFVPPGSPAMKDGWTVGDRITAIDDRKVDAGSWAEATARLRDLPAGAEVVLTDGTGRMRRLVAADYY